MMHTPCTPRRPTETFNDRVIIPRGAGSCGGGGGGGGGGAALENRLLPAY